MKTLNVRKQCIHVHCNCEDEHEIFALTCVEHPFLFNTLPEMHHKCYCKNLEPFEICNFCVERRYLLNFLCVKFCFETIPKKIENRLVTLDYYLKNETKCESFFYFGKDIIRSSLENHPYDIIKNVKKVTN